jgi:hypothetical protein
MKYLDKDNCEIDLTEERWNHILYFHPEMGMEMNFIKETLKDPDFIQSGNRDEILSVKIFEKTPVTCEKFCVVVHKKIPDKNSGFIITSYFSRRISKNRKILWEKY